MEKQEETTLQFDIQLATSGVSFFCCFIVIAGFIAFKEVRTTASKLVFYLCFVESLSAISRLFRFFHANENIECAALAFLESYSYFSVLLLISMITLSLCRSIKFGHLFIKDTIRKQIITSLFVPLILSALVTYRQFMFNDGQMCGIINDGQEIGTSDSQRLYLIFEQQLPIYFSLIFNTANVFRTFKLYNDELLTPSHSSKNHFRIYLFLFTVPICHFPSLIVQAYSSSPEWLLIVNTSVLSFQGALNAIVFGFTQRLRSKFYKILTPRSIVRDESSSLRSSLLVVDPKASTFSQSTSYEYIRSSQDSIDKSNYSSKHAANTEIGNSFASSLSEMSDLDNMSCSMSPDKQYKISIADI